jgi:hypothetical protein
MMMLVMLAEWERIDSGRSDPQEIMRVNNSAL